jgi:hypothetical protein
MRRFRGDAADAALPGRRCRGDARQVQQRTSDRFNWYVKKTFDKFLNGLPTGSAFHFSAKAMAMNHRVVALVLVSQAVGPLGPSLGPSLLRLLSLILFREGCELSHEQIAIVLRDPVMVRLELLPLDV